MTLNEIEQDIYRRLNKNAASIDTGTQTRIRAFVNQRHRELLTLPDAQGLRDSVMALTSVVDQPSYGLPQSVQRINRIWQPSNERVLEERPLDWYRSISPDPSVQTGEPDFFVVSGLQRVARQPADASSIWLKSTEGADTTQVVTVGVTDAAGYQYAFTATLTGATAVQVGTLTNIASIDNWWLATAATGIVTMHEDSGTGAELARIPVGGTTPGQWTGLYLWPTPSEALSYQIDYTRRIGDMSAAVDQPMLPEDFHRVLVYGACADECIHLDDSRYGTFKGEWAQGVADLKYWLHARASYRPGGQWNQSRGGGGNNLGAWFPAGRW